MKPDIIVIGAGGHAKVCIELLHAMRESIAFCVGGDAGPDHCLGIQVLHGDEHLASLRSGGYSRAFVALGDNRLREKLGAKCLDLGYQLVNAISPQAVVSPSAKLGTGIAIMAGAVINADSTIADLAIINTGATVDHDGQIGRAAHLAPQCALAGNVIIGDQVFLGIGTKVIPNIVVGNRSTVGAGTVIVRNIPENSLAMGVPAKIIETEGR